MAMRCGFPCRVAFFMGGDFMVYDYVPAELEEDASGFVRSMDGDVEAFLMCRRRGFITDGGAGDRFAGWWVARRYGDFPHSLVFLYEKRSELLAAGTGELQDAFMFLSWCMDEYTAVVDGLGCA